MATFYAFYPPGGAAGSNASVGTNGITAPTSSTEIGGINPSGNLQPLQTDASGSLITTQAAGAISNENVAQFGGHNVVTGTGVSGNGIPRVTVSSDSNLSIQTTGVPAGSSVTVIGAQNAASGNVVPLSTDSNTGGLNVLDQSTGITGSPVPSDASYAAGIHAGNLIGISVDASGNQNVNISSSVLPTGAATSANQTNASQKTQIVDGSGNVISSTNNALNTLIPDATTTGNITNTQSITASTAAHSSAGISISGTWSGTIVLEGSVDSVNFFPVSGAVLAGGTISTSFSANNALQTNISGLQQIRMRGNTVISGTAVITIQINATTGGVVLTESLPQGGNAIGSITNTSFVATQGTASNLNAAVVGIGTAGTPSGGVLSVQGVAGGTAISVSGTVTASNPSVGTNGATSPTSSTQTGGINAAGNLIPIEMALAPAARSTPAQVVTPSQQEFFTAGFGKVQAGADTAIFTTIQTGTGQAVSQSAGNLIQTAGTTANAETILRSTSTFTGSMLARIQTLLSQRIANNNFYVELVDLIGDGLTTTVNSATSVTVTIPSNPFTSVNVGQSMYIGAVQNISATAVPGRWAIASVSGNNVTFTVAGWPATGSGTVSLFGWNYYQLTYTSTTATNASYDAQRNGWNSGVTTATINTTASPGHMAIMMNNDGSSYLADQLVASVAGTVETVNRASRVANLALETASLYLQLRVVNGTSAPATTTTWTVGQASVENYSATAVVINDVKAQGAGSQVPVSITNSPAVTVTSGTVTTVTTVGTVTKGQGAAPATVTDIASAAIVTTTTSAAVTPTFGSSYTVSLDTTAAAGSGTFVVSIQESIDQTNWYTVYTFPAVTVASSVVTTNGVLVSPTLNMTGSTLRYVQTLNTITSVTRQAIRAQASTSAIQQAAGGILTDASSTTSATPSTSTQALGALQGRKYLFIQNVGTAVIYINFTSAATVGSGSIQIQPGGGFSQESSFISTEAVNIISATASVPFTAKQA